MDGGRDGDGRKRMEPIESLQTLIEKTLKNEQAVDRRSFSMDRRWGGGGDGQKRKDDKPYQSAASHSGPETLIHSQPPLPQSQSQSQSQSQPQPQSESESELQPELRNLSAPAAQEGSNKAEDSGEEEPAPGLVRTLIEVQTLIDIMNGIAGLGAGGCRKSVKKECSTLARRIKLLAPLVEELRDHQVPFPEKAQTCFQLLHTAFIHAAGLIKLCHDGSKIYLVVARDNVENKFVAVTRELEQALDVLPYDLLEISDEVCEQVALVHAQLKRAKGRADTQDPELLEDLAFALSQDANGATSHAAFERLAEKLQLTTLSELKQETRALHQVLSKDEGGGEENAKAGEQMSLLLKRLKGLVVAAQVSVETTSPNDDDGGDNSDEPNGGGNLASPIIPEDFKCPISLELMKDPVIVATGQTYERASIQKWLDAGNRTCPKTQQVLPHLTLTPNYALRSLILQWCETHGIALPKKEGPSKSNLAAPTSDLSPEEKKNIESLVLKLRSDQSDVQRTASGELRLLAKRNAENRVYIAEAGAIPLLVGLLWTKELRTQEHAVTALLNLSIQENNKALIVRAGAIDPIVEVLRNGGTEARENAAATLFSLSVVDDYKVSIGVSGAIPALVNLLQEGTLRGKKDAATALFNLSIYQGNKARAVRAGVVPPLMQLLADPTAEMTDEALAILAILGTHPEGRAAIGQASALPTLINLIKTGSPRNKENAAAVLFALCQNDPVHILAAKQLRAYVLLSELAQTGTNRARRKANLLLELFKQTGSSDVMPF